MILPWNFSQPENMRRHNQAVADGEYAPAHSALEAMLSAPNPALRVLDIGACCGAFAWWIMRAFPAARVESYEPNTAALHHLMQNAEKGHFTTAWKCVPRGVRAHAGQYVLHPGANNLGEASMHDIGEQKLKATAPVECIAAADLPDCDWLKVDTEGCEVEIVHVYLGSRTRPEAYPRIISFEFHRAEDFGALFEWLAVRHNYVLNRANIHRPDRGTCVFVRDA